MMDAWESEYDRPLVTQRLRRINPPTYNYEYVFDALLIPKRISREITDGRVRKNMFIYSYKSL